MWLQVTMGHIVTMNVLLIFDEDVGVSSKIVKEGRRKQLRHTATALET